ncbi:3'-5' exonuclease [Shigella sonnei]
MLESSVRQFECSPVVVVLDVESLGKGERAFLASIGAVARNVISGKELGTFYTRIDTTIEQPGRERDAGTLQWWESVLASGNKAAYDEIFDASLPRGTLTRALESLAAFFDMISAHCKPGSYIQVMGNGPEFDNSIVTHAYESNGMQVPWTFRVNQSMRTMVWMGRLLLDIDPKYTVPFHGVQHHALDDARHEAETLQVVIDRFSGALRCNDVNDRAIPVSSNNLPPEGKAVNLFDANGEGWIIGWRAMYKTWGQQNTGKWTWVFQIDGIDDDSVNITHWSKIPEDPE